MRNLFKFSFSVLFVAFSFIQESLSQECSSPPVGMTVTSYTTNDVCFPLTVDFSSPTVSLPADAPAGSTIEYGIMEAIGSGVLQMSSTPNFTEVITGITTRVICARVDCPNAGEFSAWAPSEQNITVDQAACCYVDSGFIVDNVNVNCQNNTASVTLTSNWSGTATWPGGVTTNLSGVVYGVPIGTGLSVLIESTDGCIDDVIVDVIANNNMSIEIAGPSTLCPMETTLLTTSINGGDSPYDWVWSTGDTSPSITVGTGTYSATVTDSNGCSAENSLTITEGTVGCCDVMINCSGMDATCGMPNGSAMAMAMNGDGNYSYTWSNGSSGTSVSSLAAGTYTVSVVDGGGCMAECMVTISDLGGLSNVICSGTDETCALNDGTVNVQAIDGVGPYTYSWSNGGNTANLTGLTAGFYSVTVMDAQGCSAMCNTSINGAVLPMVEVFVIQEPTCGNNNGEVSASAFGGTSPYTYAWDNGGNTSSLINLSAGNYVVTVTDAGGCLTSGMVMLSEQSGPETTIASSNPSCMGNNGTATVTASGGAGGYTYLWSDGQSSATANGLSAGMYMVTVSDQNGCQAVDNVNLIDELGPMAQCSVVQQSTCGNADGELTVSPSGGTPPYSYMWSDGQTTQTASNLSQGMYSVTVSDANACDAICMEMLTDPMPPMMMLTTMCTGSTYSIMVTSNTGDEISYDQGTLSGSAGNWVLSDINSGVVTNVTVSIAATGCSVSDQASADCAVCSVSQMNAVFCRDNGTLNNNTDDYIALSINGNVIDGSNQYSVIIDSYTSGPVNNGEEIIIEGNGVGLNPILMANGTSTFLVRVEDASDSSCFTEFVIGPIDPCCDLIASCINTDATCGASNGSAMVLGQNGDGNYTYLWSNGSTDSMINNISSGTYTVTVTDGEGCQATCEATVLDSGGVLELECMSTEETCSMMNGTAFVQPLNGVSPYSYLWSNGEMTQNIINLSPGEYSVTVMDSEGCQGVCVTTVSNSQLPDLLVTVDQNPTCGQSNGEATATGSNGTPPYSYLWSDGQTTSTAIGLGSGTYEVTLTDASGCEVSDMVSLSSDSDLMISVLVDMQPTCMANNGQATVTAMGGTPDYTYLWSDGQSSATAINLTEGMYMVTVTDQNGCEAVDNIELMSTDDLSIDCSIKLDPDCGMSNGSITATAMGGTQPYTYLWSDGQTEATATNLSQGTYSVTVTDNNGCSKICMNMLSDPNPPMVIISAQCDGSGGTYSIDVMSDFGDEIAHDQGTLNGTPGNWTISNINSADVTNITVTVMTTGCSYSEQVSIECLSCNVTETHQTNCSANGTPDDASDDYIELSLSADIINGGTFYQVVIDSYTSNPIASNSSTLIVGNGELGNPTLSADGVSTYTVRIEDASDPLCFTEFEIGPMQCNIVCPQIIYEICDDGSTSAELTTEPNLTNIQWYNESGLLVGENNETLIVNFDTPGMEDNIEEFYYSADELTGCGGRSCCPASVATIECCPTIDCLGIRVNINPTKN